ncbi:hypothetical protein V6N12_071185 [Hibiscus sabdariffa]|uniref:Inositol polyphosphate-related phosphatase domain-containing protein n=1 Tax=Hibiscus sabdariffa TaxID=183260 RepID=A0ABR2FJA5_9ROSI
MQKGKPAVGSSNKPLETHEGTKTVEADDLCNFSRNSGLCICIVTWNMNGHGIILDSGVRLRCSASIQIIWDEKKLSNQAKTCDRCLQAKTNFIRRPTEDIFSTDTVRVPSWTDRILFKIEDTDKITASLHCYESVDGTYSSDHKPVRARICFKLRYSSSELCYWLLICSRWKSY